MDVTLKRANTNVDERERLASVIAGGGLLAYGLAKRNGSSYALAAFGGYLLWRGVGGHCSLYQAFGINRAERGYAKGTGSVDGVPYELGVRVDEEMPIQKTPQELYRFWRNLENLPRFMEHLHSVNVLNDRISHWVARGPAGFKVEWDAEIVNDIENQLIGWRSLQGSHRCLACLGASNPSWPVKAFESSWISHTPMTRLYAFFNRCAKLLEAV